MTPISSAALRRAALICGGGAVSALCLWLALRRVSLGEVATSLGEVRWIWLLPVLVLTYLTLAARAVRWRYLFWEPDRVSTWESAKALNIGLLFNNILPSRAGELPRTLAIARAAGLSRVETGMTILVERLLDVLSIAVAALIMWPWLPDRRWVDALCLISAGILAAFAAGAVALWILRQRARPLVEALLGRLPFVSDVRAGGLADSLARGVRIVRKPRRVALALSLSALVWLVAALAVLALLPAFHLEASISSAWLVVIATSLALTVPSTSAGLGVYEAAAQASLVAGGVAPSKALSFALVLHAINFLPISLTGALAAWDNVGSSRRRERAAVSVLTR